MGLDETELTRPPRQEGVQKGREALMYLARRHGEVNLKELVDFLRVKRMSTVSHGMRRAEIRVKKDGDFRRSLERCWKFLSFAYAN
jgi:chromosomal replication initiation ATPase DnaA